jgi:TrmH family RNA methyltransferase
MNQKTLKKYSSLKLAKYREEYRLFLGEGKHIVDELLSSDYEVESIITSRRDIFDELRNIRENLKIELIGPAAIARIATTRTPQEILAVVRIPERLDPDPAKQDRIVIADGIKDPGNMGTIIRTARAFGFDLVMTTADSADIYNPKVVRSTQGAIFAIKTMTSMKSEEIIRRLGSTHTFYSLATGGKTELDQVRPAKKSALVIGTEIRGVSRAFLDNSDFIIRIPHRKEADSLNAAVAAGIAMYVFSLKSQFDLS